KNNTQNVYITFHVADKGDIWFHAKNRPGSHVIMLCDGEEPSEKDYTEAAMIAAYHSKSSGDALIEVDYTKVKNIKKPSGAKPGFVIYHTNYSTLARRDADAVSEMQSGK
ncbi:MAG: NFACT RNA binding domain-containing protein, partial [Clostridia bacterium]|nr:NFACT RNA binding domain-containing protein [Clostridia bacterium]